MATNMPPVHAVDGAYRPVYRPQTAHRRIARGVIARANPGTMMERPKTPFLGDYSKVTGRIE